MAKNPTKERAGRKGTQVQRITTVDNPDSAGPGLFIAALGLILVGGIAATVFFASTRESNIGVAPVANDDHWHSAFLISNCGTDLPATSLFENPDGLHTHGQGLLHLHPFNPSASGINATLGQYFDGAGAELTDSSFTTGFSDVFPTTMSEANGCGGESATLQLAVWENAFDETAEPEIITENLRDFRFTSAGMAITLALVADGEEAPRPPAERIAQLAETGPGGPIAGVEIGESPVVTASTVAPPEVEDDADADGEAEDGADADADTTDTTVADEDDTTDSTADAGSDDGESEEDDS